MTMPQAPGKKLRQAQNQNLSKTGRARKPGLNSTNSKYEHYRMSRLEL